MREPSRPQPRRRGRGRARRTGSGTWSPPGGLAPGSDAPPKRRQSAGKVSRGAGGGNAPAMFGRWRRKREENRADKQQGDPHALDREGDPRGGVQSEEYRHAEPTEVVEEEGVVMSGPGGAPQEDLSPDERRERDRS